MGATSFEMLELNHTFISKTIIISIMLNIETVENATPERKGRMYVRRRVPPYKAALILGLEKNRFSWPTEPGRARGVGSTMSFIFCTLMFWHLGLSWPWRDCSSQEYPIPWEDSPTGDIFKDKPANPELTPQLPPSSRAHTAGHYPSALTTQGQASNS